MELFSGSTHVSLKIHCLRILCWAGRKNSRGLGIWIGQVLCGLFKSGIYGALFGDGLCLAIIYLLLSLGFVFIRLLFYLEL